MVRWVIKLLYSMVVLKRTKRYLRERAFKHKTPPNRANCSLLSKDTTGNSKHLSLPLGFILYSTMVATLSLIW